MDIIGNKTLNSLLEQQLQQNPNKTFLKVESDDRTIETATYKQFAEKVRKLMTVLDEMGIKKGDKVLLHLPNSMNFMISWFAISGMGAVMVPTNILSAKAEMDFLVTHSKAKMVVTEEEYIEKFTDLNVEILLSRYKGTKHQDKHLDHLMNLASPYSRPLDINSDDLAAILYTSGTTSNPKGVMITHANYVYAGEYMSRMLKMTEQDCGLVVLPMFHGNGQYYLTMPLLTVGGTVAITEKFSASRYFEQAALFEATIGSLFAAPIKMILRRGSGNTCDHQLKKIIFAQSVTKEQLVEFEQTSHVELSQIYGMTETIGTPLMNPIDGICKNMSIGQPGLGYEVRLVNEHGNDVATGDAGQIIVKGEPGRTLMLGYYDDEEATKKALQDGWLYTGDNARVGDDGYFYFVDRLKDMVKRAGENIATSEIETVLNQHPQIADSAVVGVDDEIRDVALKAFVILKEGAHLTEKEVISHCQGLLAKFKIPEYIEFIDEFPRTSVGKIQKAKLRDLNKKV
ncbi:AMP-binding protein [Alkalihalobacterium chitinilyticum]|uniref:AMP-binding protein n=1 Tax=Alkalihalobacterium chitinilyticum TaxID=2980103 RepID=A0ABT5VFV9_9BACI|nr:AMP-binding protein [Alkalihalobacterium chitinilyticum]MDE5414348.1 AMP-binding protein [Alkalihalobacterium chitinilyticum]